MMRSVHTHASTKFKEKKSMFDQLTSGTCNQKICEISFTENHKFVVNNTVPAVFSEVQIP